MRLVGGQVRLSLSPGDSEVHSRDVGRPPAQTPAPGQHSVPPSSPQVANGVALVVAWSQGEGTSLPAGPGEWALPSPSWAESSQAPSVPWSPVVTLGDHGAGWGEALGLGMHSEPLGSLSCSALCQDGGLVCLADLPLPILSVLCLDGLCIWRSACLSPISCSL